MISRFIITAFFLLGSHLAAETLKRENSLFLEYEREVSKQAEPEEPADSPFKKIITKLTPAKPKTPYVPAPIAPSLPSEPILDEKIPIGHDTLPYLVISKPVEENKIVCETVSSDMKTENTEPKKSLFENLSSKKDKLLAKAKDFLGTPYGFGSKNSSQTDCSGFTQQVYKQFGVALPHSAAEQAKFGAKVSVEDLQVGDLMFYQTYKSEPSHVGIYAGDGRMIHASYSNKKVQYDSIDKGYYKQRFLYAKRLALNSQDSSND